MTKAIATLLILTVLITGRAAEVRQVAAVTTPTTVATIIKN